MEGNWKVREKASEMHSPSQHALTDCGLLKAKEAEHEAALTALKSEYEQQAAKTVRVSVRAASGGRVRVRAGGGDGRPVTLTLTLSGDGRPVDGGRRTGRSQEASSHH